VLSNKADIGLAFDGDADRLGVITNEGTVIWPDRLMMLFAKSSLATSPGETIVFDVKCSSHLAAVIQESQGVAKMCPTGHSIVKSVMRTEKAALAGEMSGHIFFNDRWYGFDDALYGACRLLEIISSSSDTVEAQFLQIPNSVNTPEIKIPLADDKKFLLMQRFCENARFNDAKIITIDGLRVEFAKGWGLLRASNTTPSLVARFEAEDKESLSQIQALFKAEWLRISGDMVLPFG
jgi:phosphomannomutase